MQKIRLEKDYLVPSILWLGLGAAVFLKLLLPIIMSLQASAAAPLPAAGEEWNSQKAHEGADEQ